MWNKIIRLGGFVFFAMAVWLIAGEIKTVGAGKLIHLMNQISPLTIEGMILFIIADYIALSGYDLLAFRYIGKSLPYSQIAEASGISFAISNITGHVYAAGGIIRYLFYVPKGITKAEILKMIIFETMTVLMGMGAAYLLSMGIAPFERSIYDYRCIDALYGMAIFILLVFVAYFTLFVVPKRSIKIRNLILKIPGNKMTIMQILLGLADNIFLFLVFYIGLRYYIQAPLFETFMIFIIAQSIGLITQVPGGIGVFESSFLCVFPYAPGQKGEILMSLLLFRVMYYFMPFGLACIYLGVRRYLKKCKIC